jgi:hypothetical protein
MKKKLLILATILLALAVILPACHTVLIGLQTQNRLGCTLPRVTYQVPGFGLPVANSGPHVLTHTNVANNTNTAFDPMGAGFGPTFVIEYDIAASSCCGGGTGEITNIGNPPGNWFVTWTCGSNDVASAAAAAE